MRTLFCKVYKHGLDRYLGEIRVALQNEEKKFVVTANPETFMIAERMQGFRSLLLDSRTSLVPDGIGILKMAGVLRCPVRECIAGIDLMQGMLAMGSQMGKSAYFFGAKPEVIRKLKKTVEKKYPGIRIVGCADGYADNTQAIFDDIILKKPDMIFVALGIPAQEMIIYRNLDRLQRGVAVGVGGSFDVISGEKKRAPDIFIRLRLEWLYRISVEPKRLKRFFRSNIVFVFKVLRLAWGSRKGLQ